MFNFLCDVHSKQCHMTSIGQTLWEGVFSFCLSVRDARISLKAILPFLRSRAAPGLAGLQRSAVKIAETKTHGNTVEWRSGHQGPGPSSVLTY